MLCVGCGLWVRPLKKLKSTLTRLDIPALGRPEEGLELVIRVEAVIHSHVHTISLRPGRDKATVGRRVSSDQG